MRDQISGPDPAERTIRVIRRADREYPERLRQQERMPDLLYVLGRLPDPEAKSVAVVGARACSAYGRQEALRFAAALARHGIQVISGLAAGIDSWAHIGALEGGGKTFAVLGSGPDVCYPRSNVQLYQRILREGGGILSEYGPGMPAMAHHFPQRNRIISALADIVLVVEARKRSGSLITVSYALEQGKSIYAVPGKNGEALSEGCNRLLAEGAAAALEPETILQELGIMQNDGPELPREGRKLPPQLLENAACRELYAVLSSEEKSLDRLLQETGLPLPELTEALIRLCTAGFAEEQPGRRYTGNIWLPE